MNKEETKKITGKVFTTIIGTEKCECGSDVIMKTFVLIEYGIEGKRIYPDKKIRIGFCECGNVFKREIFLV